MLSIKLERGLWGTKSFTLSVWSLTEDLTRPEGFRGTRQNWNKFSEWCIPSWSGRGWVLKYSTCHHQFREFSSATWDPQWSIPPNIFILFFLSLSYNMCTESFSDLMFPESSVLYLAQSQDLGFPVVLVQVLQDSTASKIKVLSSQRGLENNTFREV